MNEKELFDALAENCPNELKKHDAKVRADAIDEILKYYECSFGGLVVPVRKIKQIKAEIMEQLKEHSNE